MHRTWGRWIVAGAGLLLTLACGGALSEEEHALDASDHAVLLEMADIAGEFPNVTVDPSAETWSKVKSMGTWELEYAYETDGFALSSMAFIEDDPDSASWVMWGTGLAPAMLENEGLTFREDSTLLTLGDERNCGVVENAGVPLGNLCTVRDGSAVVFFILIGGYFDAPGDLDRVLAPVLTATKGYTPVESPLPPENP